MAADPTRTTALSMLDLSPIPTGSGPAQALAASIETARRADELGLTRYWVAEHHGMPGIASSAPAVLIGALAAATSRIRVGSGGVMLPNHPPLVVAEQFGTLDALFPGRIDLGLGRAPGTDPRTAMALRRSVAPLSADDFPEQLAELVGYLEADPHDTAPGVRAVPGAGARPALWLLGSSDYSARLAGLLGLPFAFAHHFSSHNTVPASQIYRESFRPSATLRRPHLMVTASVVCAESDERAHWLAAPATLSFLRLRQGRPSTLPSPQEAAAHPLSDAERSALAVWTNGQVVGAPNTVRDGLTDLMAMTAADELMVTTTVHDVADRVRSLELLVTAVPPAGTAAVPDIRSVATH